MTQNENNSQPHSAASANASAAAPVVNSSQSKIESKPAAPTAVKPVAKAASASPKKSPKSAKPASKAAKRASKSASKTAANATKAARNINQATQRVAEKTFDSARQNATRFASLLNTDNLKTSYQNMESYMTNNAQFEKATQQAAETSRQGVEAWVKSCNIWIRGYEDLVKTCLNIAQSSTERNSEAVKSLLGCKTLNELTETHNQIAQRNFDDLVTNATKLSEISIKVATDTIQPINDQIGKTVRKATNAA